LLSNGQLSDAVGKALFTQATVAAHLGTKTLLTGLRDPFLFI
jgi:hypothetical protein